MFSSPVISGSAIERGKTLPFCLCGFLLRTILGREEIHKNCHPPRLLSSRTLCLLFRCYCDGVVLLWNRETNGFWRGGGTQVEWGKVQRLGARGTPPCCILHKKNFVR